MANLSGHTIASNWSHQRAITCHSMLPLVGWKQWKSRLGDVEAKYELEGEEMLILVTEDAELLKGVLHFFVLADQQPGDRKVAAAYCGPLSTCRWLRRRHSRSRRLLGSSKPPWRCSLARSSAGGTGFHPFKGKLIPSFHPRKNLAVGTYSR